MSNAEFSISREHFKTIMQFVDFMNKDEWLINTQKARWWLSKIEYEMKQYENEGCEVVVEVCKEIRITSCKKYTNSVNIEKALIRFSNAVNEVVSDEVFNSVYFI